MYRYLLFALGVSAACIQNVTVQCCPAEQSEDKLLGPLPRTALVQVLVEPHVTHVNSTHVGVVDRTTDGMRLTLLRRDSLFHVSRSTFHVPKP